MKNENCVIFKGRRRGLVIELDPNAPFSDIKHALSHKLVAGKQFFSDAQTPLLFQGRDITDEEADILVDIIKKESGITISFTQTDGYSIFAQNAKPAPTTVVHVESEEIFDESENKTRYVFGSLRGGQSVRHNGSVVVVGDVNPGAEIVADGHVTVLGALRGMAHAGASGNDECFVFALTMNPTQLRIDDIITRFPAKTRFSDIGRKLFGKKNKDTETTVFVPSLAFIRDGQIFVDPMG